MNELQKWCQKILPVVTAAANGEEIEYLNFNKWKTKDALCFDHNTDYRVKSNVKIINDIEVPMHMTVKPAGGSLCWIANPLHHELAEETFYSDVIYHWLKRGLLYTNKQDAIKCAKAMLGEAV